ncbi:DMT family transporter [Cellulomonas marina]|uniref:Threonine/homoserine efflux transporter RhtA n=1 Tax=Cellulomonas marina TaxID=988821 RepID=A0A1I1A5F4_9CELL|nr:DMT family transporter [Cellulomonas marina]GIG30502.1 hypothetical protein Cma02nite_31020 [Cellulomonas marina]SFB31720.1 Threonine/homoserine efflux transporter RhtA [Cellulomonas marina]
MWLRWLLALPLLVLVAQVLERPDWRAVARAWPWVLALGATGLAGYTLLLYAALRLTTPLDAAIVNAVNPALIVLAAVALLGERVTARGVLGVAVAFVGVVVVLTDGRPAAALTGGVNGGDLLMLGAISTWTAYTVIGRRGPRLPPVASTAAQALVVVVGLAPVVAVAGLRLPGDAAGMWALVFIVLLPSVGSYVLWNTALRTVPPSRAGVYLNLITVFTAAATALLGHPLSAAQLVGGAVVLAGIALTTTATPR